MTSSVTFSNSKLVLITALAALIFSPLFIFRSIGPFDFWYWMSTNLIVVISLGLITDPSYRRMLRDDISGKIPYKIIIGFASAAVLYLVFYLGNMLSRMWFDFAGEGIANVYAFKGDAEAIRIGLLMLLVIGPGEELFWRGFLQRHFAARFGPWAGFLLGTLIYTGVHVFTGNLMLIVAALVAGLFWGWMYLRYRSMVMNVVSHTVWDIAVFLILPFMA